MGSAAADRLQADLIERLRSELADAKAELDRERSRSHQAHEKIAALEAQVQRQLAELQWVAKGTSMMEAVLHAVAHDPVYGPPLRVALDDILGRPGWTTEHSEIINLDFLPLLDNFSWVLPGEVAACARPNVEPAVRFLAEQGVRRLLSLEVPPAEEWLSSNGIDCRYIPVPDYTPPTHDQLEEAVAYIDESLAAGHPIAVHCLGGKGRSGAVLAAYLVHRGYAPEEAAEIIVQRRPYSVAMKDLAVVGQQFATKRRGAPTP